MKQQRKIAQAEQLLPIIPKIASIQCQLFLPAYLVQTSIYATQNVLHVYNN